MVLVSMLSRHTAVPMLPTGVPGRHTGRSSSNYNRGCTRISGCFACSSAVSSCVKSNPLLSVSPAYALLNFSTAADVPRPLPRQLLERRGLSPCSCSCLGAGRIFAASSGLQEAEHEQLLVDDLRCMRVGDLKDRLLAIGVDGEGLLDKEALVSHLVEHYMRARSQVVALHLRRTPQRLYGSKSHLVVPVDLDGVGFSDFLLDSGSSSTLITAELRSELGISPMDGRYMNGLDSSGRTVRQKVHLPVVRLGQRELDLKEAIVTKLELSSDIGGVLGLSFLRQVEVDLDADSGTLEFHPIGHVEQGVLHISGMTKLELGVAKGGLLVLSATLNGSPPMPAIVDISASCSMVNGPAARLAGITSGRGHVSDERGVVGPFLDVSLGHTSGDLGMAFGANSSFRPLPSGLEQGDQPSISGDEGGGTACFGQLSTRISQPVLVRELPGLTSLGFGDVPVMVLGMDLLCRSRVVFCFGSNTMYVQNEF